MASAGGAGVEQPCTIMRRRCKRPRLGDVPWYCPDEYVQIVRSTRRRARCVALLRPHEPARWLPRHELVNTEWPPPHTLLASERRALGELALRELDACAARCTSWAPHDQLGYSFAQLDDDALRGAASREITRVVGALAAKTWGRRFAAENPPWMTAGTAFLLKYDRSARPPPPHLDIKALPGAGAQTANAIVYLSSSASGETVLLGAAGAADTRIEPERGKVVVWRSYTEDGCVDPRARHTARAYTGGGEKLLLALSLRRELG